MWACMWQGERDSSSFQTLLHKRHINVKLFQGKPICNMDSSSPGAELNGEYWPWPLHWHQMQSKQRGRVHFSRASLWYSLPKVLLSQNSVDRVLGSRSRDWQLRKAGLNLFLFCTPGTFFHWTSYVLHANWIQIWEEISAEFFTAMFYFIRFVIKLL